MAKKKSMKGIGERPPKWMDSFVERAGDLAREGKTVAEIATEFKVSEKTLYQWQNEKSELGEAIKKGRDEYDTKHVESSLRRLTSFYTTTSQVYDQKKRQVVNLVHEHPANITAIIFWLCNRGRSRWASVSKILHHVEGEVEHHLSDGDRALLQQIADAYLAKRYDLPQKERREAS